MRVPTRRRDGSFATRIATRRRRRSTHAERDVTSDACSKTVVYSRISVSTTTGSVLRMRVRSAMAVGVGVGPVAYMLAGRRWSNHWE